MSESFNLKGYIVTVDIEKAFDSLSHSFLLVCIKKYGYGNDFIKWVEMLRECQESCIINGGILNFKKVLDKGMWVCFMFAECLSWRAPLEDCS